MQNKVIDVEETAELLGISEASVRNWFKRGYLHSVDSKRQLFKLSDVLKLKELIKEGKIDRLKRRANKTNAQKKFIPIEYIGNEEYRALISHLINYLVEQEVEKKMAILVLALKLFYIKGDIKSDKFTDIFSFRPEFFKRKSVYCELQDFFGEIIGEKPFKSADFKKFEYIFNYPLPLGQDILGIVYQALTFEGEKANLGSYFTPPEIVNSMVNDLFKNNYQQVQKVLDPCCGTGQFLLAFADHVRYPDSIIGVDIDLTAVRIARINLLLKFSEDFQPRIYHFDALSDIGGLNRETVDCIATNPPWGAKISKDTQARIIDRFPEISSGESFSYFVRAAISFLKTGGKASFVLPEAILNVRTHEDIRKFILSNCQILRIEALGKRFKNVLSPVIRIDLQKKEPDCGGKVQIILKNEEYKIVQKRFGKNKWSVFDIYLTEQDESILDKVYRQNHITLEDKAIWALGIVTGDNRKYIIDKPREGYEPIYRGTDVEPFTLKKPSNYINLCWEEFQQAAPIDKYRAREKLVYKFVSRIPVFAYDDKASLTLNSANILIPNMSYPLKVILALFNSNLYRFIYLKKFHSLKVLRGDLEQLPLPLWEEHIFQYICGIVDEILGGKKKYESLDLYIMSQFGLSDEEIAYIKAYLKQMPNGPSC